MNKSISDQTCRSRFGLGLLVTVDGLGSEDEVTSRLFEAIDGVLPAAG